MTMTLLLGGARSGKSDLASRLIAGETSDVAVIATGEPRDEEMRERIDRHREGRPAGWLTIEEPVDLAGAIASVPDETRVVIDCLTVWVSNLLERGFAGEDIETRARSAAALAAARGAGTVVVSNEVGSGIVPDNATARSYRDLLGRVNTIWAGMSSRVFLAVAGGLIPVRSPESVGLVDD